MIDFNPKISTFEENLRKVMRYIQLVILAILLVSCNFNQQNRSLAETDSMLLKKPERVLAILDSMEKVTSLNDDEQMHLVWNRALAHQALGMSLAEDEQLPEAIAYYRKDADKQTDSYLLEAIYLNWTGKENDAIKAIDKGLANIADITKRVRLLETKASILEHQRKFDQAVGVLKEALDYAKTKREQAILQYRMGLSLSLLGEGRSDHFYERSIRLAKESGDTTMACEFMRNYADFLANNGQYRRSNDFYYQIVQMMPQIGELSAIQAAMASNYINLHKLDSARICNDKAIRSEEKLERQGYSNITGRAILEQERYLLDYAEGRTVSYVDFARYCDSITNDMLAKEKTSNQRLETKNRLQAANYELKLGKQRMVWMLSLSLLLLLGGGIGVYLYNRNRLQRLAEAEDRIDTLTRMLSEAQDVTTEDTLDVEQSKTDDDAFFKKILLQQLGIIRLVASTPTNQNQALLRRISGIGGGEIPTNSLLVWPDLYPVIDRLYDNFHTRLMERYGNVLTEKEEQICCLLCARFSTKEIGVITQQSDATIYVRKSAIRKKIGATEGQDIVACVNGVKA